MFRFSILIILWVTVNYKADAQEKKLSGTVLIVEDGNFSEVPAVRHRVSLITIRNSFKDCYTGDDGKFDFSGDPKKFAKLELDQKYYVVIITHPKGELPWSWTKDYMLLYVIKKRTNVQRDRTAFNEAAIEGRERLLKYKIHYLRSDTTLSLARAEEKIDRTREKLFNEQTRVAELANIFALTDFSQLDSAYLLAMEYYMSGHDSLLSKTLDERLFTQPMPKYKELNKTKAAAYVMKGGLSPDGVTMYVKAINTDSSKFTIVNYTNHLFDQDRFKESIPLLFEVRALYAKDKQFSDSIYTLGQLVRVYDSLDNSGKASHMFALSVDKFRKKIIKGKVQREHSAWIVARKSLMNYYYKKALTTRFKKDWKKYRKAIRGLKKYYSREYEINTDSAYFWLADKSELTFKLASFFDSIKVRHRKADRLYRQAINIAYKQMLASHDPRHVELLSRLYRAYQVRGYHERRKNKFFRREIIKVSKEESLIPGQKTLLEKIIGADL